MSLIAAVRTYIAGYTGLSSSAPVWVDYLGPEPTEYAIVPLPGQRTIETYLDGSKQRVYPFAFQFVESTADDAQRLDTAEFSEAFAAWLDEQTESGVLPALDTGKTAEKIEAVNWGYLDKQGESDTAIYLVSCQLIYEQVAP